MKINFGLLHQDGLGDWHLKGECPKMFGVEATNIMRLLTHTPIADYNKMSGFDKALMAKYWMHYDGLIGCLVDNDSFYDWFTKKATNPENIRRARQWLIEHNYLIPKKAVEERAQATSEKWRSGVKVR